MDRRQIAIEEHVRGGKPSFRTDQLYKDQTLGIGSYGKVCHARCDDLICAAKVIHETLFDPQVQYDVAPRREHRLPIRRFEQECEFLSAIKHPNIVQYLGIHQDPDTGSPLLLMELMDESLTHFLERLPTPAPYHIQVNFCHDITLALSFLHSNDIIHRDLSSNNVLMIGNVRAKVTDFGMAQLTPTETQYTFTMCPGTDVYMPPEAVDDNPVYSEKLDCFSFGVLTIQILTRQFPRPGNRRESVQINHPRFPGGSVQANVPEVTRRQNHIREIDPNHPLLPLALDCLRDNAVERPSAQQLCNRLATLKQTSNYRQSTVSQQERGTRSEEVSRTQHEAATTTGLSHQQHAQRVQGLQQIIESQTSRLREKDQIISGKDQVIATERFNNQQLRRESQESAVTLKRVREQIIDKDKTIQDKESQLTLIKQKLEISEEVVDQFEKRIQELEKLVSTCQVHQTSGIQPTAVMAADLRTDAKITIQLSWRGGERAPCVMRRGCDAIAHGGIVYCRHFRLKKIYLFHPSGETWFQVPDSPVQYFSMAFVNGILTIVGGEKNVTSGFGRPKFGRDSITNKLISLVENGGVGNWTEILPPMPTKRKGTVSLSTDMYLIVAGGEGERGVILATVEVFSIYTSQWSTAPSLPEPKNLPSATIVGEEVFVAGGEIRSCRETSSVYSCSVKALVNSCSTSQTRSSADFTNNVGSGTWKKIADLPVFFSACTSLRGQLIAVGGKTANNQSVSAVHMYDPMTNSWGIISQMPLNRHLCQAVAMDNQLIVVGGVNDAGTIADSTYIASVV